MAGTKIGGKRAARTNKEKYGPEFYEVIGRKGGKLGRTGGFAYSKAHGLTTHIEAGRIGGLVSKRKAK